MALKGKKKSRARGSQARRRPASAPRPAYGSHEKPRWYQTTQGLVIGFIAAAALVTFVWWFVADNRSESQAREATREQLQTYTSDVRTLIQNLTPIASELGTAGTLNDKQLIEQSKSWKSQLNDVQTTVTQMVPPDDLSGAGGLVSQALVLYLHSIEQYELLPDLEGAPREAMAAKASGSLQIASGLFSTLIEILDGERSEVDLQGSGLQPPGMQATTSAPGTTGDEVELPTSDEVELPSGDEGNE